MGDDIKHHGKDKQKLKEIERKLKMNKVTFDSEMCKGCGLCVAFCPKKIIELSSQKFNKKGYHSAAIIEGGQEKCIACAICATMCPDAVIKVEKDV